MLGGFIFGVGASINQACSISTMNQLAKGHIGKLLTIMGWFIGWSIWTQLISQQFLFVEYKQANPLSLTSTLVVSSTVLFFVVVFIVTYKPPIKLILGVLFIGTMATLLFCLVPDWPPSQLMIDMGSSLFHETPIPSMIRMGVVIALLTGMWIAVAINHNARIRFPRWRAGVRFLIAGTMMGIGAGMALGGNDTQLLFGIPATSPGSLSALLFIFIGIVSEQLFYQHGASFYRKIYRKTY